jgi:hypothetical protein
LQDCKEFHQAKDGDGWVEQSSQPVLFGMLQKVNAKLFEPLILLFKNFNFFSGNKMMYLCTTSRAVVCIKLQT